MSLTRRAFAMGFASAAAAATLPRPLGAAALPPAARRALARQDQDPSPEAQALAQVVRLRFPERFTEAQQGDILRDIDGGVRRARRLAAPALHNWDEPDTVFRPYRGAD